MRRRPAAFVTLLLLLAFPAGLHAVAVQREQVAVPVPEDPWHEEAQGSGFRAQGPLAPDWEDPGRRPGPPRLMRHEAPPRGRASEEPEPLSDVLDRSLEASLLEASGQDVQSDAYPGRTRRWYKTPAPAGDGGGPAPQPPPPPPPPLPPPPPQPKPPAPAPVPQGAGEDMDGGPPPDLANSPYFPADEQKGKCEEGGREMTREECKEAADAAGYKFDGIVDVPTQPRSCSCRASSNPQYGKCVFNTHPTGMPNPGMVLMCKISGPRSDDSAVYNGNLAPSATVPPVVQQMVAPTPAPPPPTTAKTTTLETTITTTTVAAKPTDTAPQANTTTNSSNGTAAAALKGSSTVFIGAGLLLCCVGGGGAVVYQQKQARGGKGGEDGEVEGGGGELAAHVGDWVNVLSKGQSGEVTDVDEQKGTYTIRFEDGSTATVPSSDIESAFGGGAEADFAEAPAGNPP